MYHCTVSSPVIDNHAIHSSLSQERRNEQLKHRRLGGLRRLDRELEKGNYKSAFSLLKRLRAQPSRILRGFGAITVRRSISLDEINRNKVISKSSLETIVDAILHSVNRSLEFQLQEDEAETLSQNSGQVIDAEGGNSICESQLTCAQHEAGHFLVGYMLGVFPKRYKVPSLEDLQHDRFARGKVQFLGFEFLKAVDMANMSKGSLNSEILKKFSCVILGGLAAEHRTFGYSELLHSDVEKLDRVLKWLGLSEKEATNLTRQAAETVVLILCRHREAQSRLATAMSSGKSIGSCIETIESALNFEDE